MNLWPYLQNFIGYFFDKWIPLSPLPHLDYLFPDLKDDNSVMDESRDFLWLLHSKQYHFEKRQSNTIYILVRILPLLKTTLFIVFFCWQGSKTSSKARLMAKVQHTSKIHSTKRAGWLASLCHLLFSRLNIF